ncbi:MAG: LPS assembly lipoprotein LptE [Brachymonas sp.]|nr:LPS assembly lipoprotein LptE [Brachymonas sp.]MDO4796100.1 LPS assembly lipoprotein LptE [Brachymonas sp.]
MSKLGTSMHRLNRRQFMGLSLAAAGAASATLAGCGFRLRGADLHYPFRSIHIAGNGSAMTHLLQRLLAGQAQVAAQAADAEVILTVLLDQEERSASALGTSAKVREVELRRQFDFSLVDAKGNTLIESAPIVLRRFVSYSENEATGKEAEFEILFSDMRNDAAQQVLRRLAATRPAAQ